MKEMCSRRPAAKNQISEYVYSDKAPVFDPCDLQANNGSNHKCKALCTDQINESLLETKRCVRNGSGKANLSTLARYDMAPDRKTL